MAVLMLSVPQLVKIISVAGAPMSAATDSRAASIGPTSFFAQPVGARRIAPFLGQVRQHRLQHFRCDARRGIAIEIVSLGLGHGECLVDAGNPGGREI